MRWVLLYAITVSAMVWWYEFRPAWNAARQIQGNWCEVEGRIPDERLGDSFMQITGDDTWRVYPFHGQWEVQRSRITVRPAENFFVVRRAFGFDYGTTRETEYILCIKGDGLYVLRGLATLDSVRDYTAVKLQRVDSLPDGAGDSIREYLERLSAASSVTQAPPARD